jgi:hypothetical protein
MIRARASANAMREVSIVIHRPLLSDMSGRTGAAGRIEHEIAGVGAHENAPRDDALIRLYYVNLIRRTPQAIPPIRD